MSRPVRDIRALTRDVATLRAEIEEYRAELREVLNRFLDDCSPAGGEVRSDHTGWDRFDGV